MAGAPGRGASTVSLNIGFHVSPTKLKAVRISLFAFLWHSTACGSLLPPRGVALDFLYPFDEFFIGDLVWSAFGFLHPHARGGRLPRGLLVIHAMTPSWFNQAP